MVVATGGSGATPSLRSLMGDAMRVTIAEPFANDCAESVPMAIRLLEFSATVASDEFDMFSRDGQSSVACDFDVWNGEDWVGESASALDAPARPPLGLRSNLAAGSSTGR